MSSRGDDLQLKNDLMKTSEHFPRTAAAFLDTVYELVSSIAARERDRERE